MRRCGRAVRWVYVQTKALRKFLQQGLDAVGQLLGVPIHVLRVNGEQRLLVGVGIRPRVSADITGRHFGVATFPVGDSALGIGRTLRPHGRKRVLEFLRLGRRNRRVHQGSDAEGDTD
ncbi:hypothetical protein D3C81_1847790 [compost metagenome]